MSMPIYTIQEWLFSFAEGKYDIDLGESGIQYHHLHDLDLSSNCHLNYEQDRGEINLRKAIASLYGLSCDDIAITHGSQEALYLLYRSYLQPKDHVITTVPGWQQSWSVPEHIGCVVDKIRLQADLNYQLDIDAIKSRCQSSTKMIILNNPNNPTAVGFLRADLKELCLWAKTRGILVVLDEEYFTDYENSLVCELENVVSVHSLSKVYGFPGLRLGFLVSKNKEIIERVVNYKRYVTVSNSSLCTSLGLQVINNHKSLLKDYYAQCESGLSMLKSKFSDVEAFEIVPTKEMPFAYVKTKSINSANFAKKLLEDFRTLIMPAEVFDDSFAIRISIARPKALLEQGLNNIKDCFNRF